MIAESKGKDDRKFELVEDPDALLRDLNTYLPNLMNYLWEQPKIVVNVIKNSDITNLKEYLAPFIANNFYENILSSYYIEDNLMYVLTMLLDDEINNLTNINQDDIFLNNTPCGCLLEELRRKKDIQAFFKTIIFNDVENLEVNYSTFNLNFNISNLTEEYRRQSITQKIKFKKIKRDDGYFKNPIENQRGSISLEDFNYFKNKKKLQSQLENFNQKYIPTLDKDALENLFEKFKNNKKMHDYFYSKLDDCNINKDIYSNLKLMGNLYNSEFSEDLILKYQNYFTIVISFIDSIIEKIMENFHLIPYSVKCLCKIISMLITKKFPSINETEKNAYIANFFFGKLLFPILENPSIEAFISNFIISGSTLKNLKTICKIFQKLTSGRFYKADEKTSDYTPYNWYFIDKMEKLFIIFEQITKVKLPSFIEKYINKELHEDYEYNYFEENPDEDINLRSICFNLDQVNALLNTMNKNKDQIFISNSNSKSKKVIGLKKTMEKLMSPNNQEILRSILNKEKKDKKNNQTQNQKAKKKRKRKRKRKKKKKKKKKRKNKKSLTQYCIIF